MKKAFIYSLLTATLALASCTKTELAPLKGIYPAAQEPVLTTLAASSFEKTDANRIFHVKFTGEGNSAVDTYLVGARAQYYLEPGVYGPGDKNLCFLVDGKTTINGKAVKDGQITVKKDGDNYRFVFVLFDTEGNAYRTMWQGELAYEPDPEPVALTKVLTAQSNVESGTNSVTLSLGTSGLESVNGTVTGDGNYLAVDLYSADGYLHEGTYTASAAGGVINEGEFGIGWDPGDLWGIGWVFENWGTCWWTVSGGQSSARKITSGTITVEKKGSKYVITWGSENTYPDWAVFEGTVDALAPGSGPSYDYTYTENLSDAVDSSFSPVAGVKTHNLVFFNAAGEDVAYFDLVLAEGETDLSGEYTCTEYAHEPYTFGNGYDLSMWGMGVGGSRYVGADGAVVLLGVGEKLTVTKLGEGIYEFAGNGFDFIVGSGNGGGSTVTADYTITESLSDAVDSSFSPVAGVKTHNLVFFNAAGEDVAYFDLVLAEGETDLSGEYTCTEYAHEPFTFGNGYDLSMWGMGVGGSRYTGADGAVVLISPAETLTVTKLAEGIYKFAGSTGYEFVGEMAE